MSAAAVRAEEINEVFGHTRPNGKACRTVLEELGYEGDYAGENIAGGQFKLLAVEIMNSGTMRNHDQFQKIMRMLRFF